MLVLIVNTLCGTSIGLMIGSAIPNHSASTAIAPIVLAPCVIFSGLPVNLGTVYVWLRWLQYLSPLRYTFEILIRNEF